MISLGGLIVQKSRIKINGYTVSAFCYQDDVNYHIRQHSRNKKVIIKRSLEDALNWALQDKGECLHNGKLTQTYLDSKVYCEVCNQIINKSDLDIKVEK